MKWHWILLLAGLGLYALVLIPGLVPHTIDIAITVLAGMIIATVAVFGFDSTHVDRRLASLMVVVGSAVLLTGITLAWRGHAYSLVLLSVPAIGLGLFGLRKLLDERKKDE